MFSVMVVYSGILVAIKAVCIVLYSKLHNTTNELIISTNLSRLKLTFIVLKI